MPIEQFKEWAKSDAPKAGPVKAKETLTIKEIDKEGKVSVGGGLFRFANEYVKAAEPLAPTSDKIDGSEANIPEKAEVKPDFSKRDRAVNVDFTSGQIVETSTGRKTKPYPKVDNLSDRKAGNTVKRSDAWLIGEAMDEARSRGDEFNQRMFDNIDIDHISESDRESAKLYLFDENVIPVPKPFLKDLTPKSPLQEEVTKAKEALIVEGHKVEVIKHPGYGPPFQAFVSGKPGTGVKILKGEPMTATGSTKEEAVENLRKKIIYVNLKDKSVPKPKPPAAVPAETPQLAAKTEPDRFAGNKVFTGDMVKDALARLKARQNTLNSGFNPLDAQDMFIIGGAYFESGIRKFTDWEKEVTAAVGNDLAIYLPDVYSMIRKTPGIDTEGMSSQEEVEAAVNKEKAPPKTKLQSEIAEAKTRPMLEELKLLDTEIEQLYQLRECLKS